MTYFKIISTRVFLRPLTEEDAAALFSYRSKPEITEFQLWKPEDITDAIRFIKKAKFHSEFINQQWNQLAICLQSNDEMIGDIGLLLKDHEAELGFTIAPRFQGKGLAFEAVTSLVDYLFHNHIVRRIVAYTDRNNTRSIGLLKKIGFKLISPDTHIEKDHGDLGFVLKNPENRL